MKYIPFLMSHDTSRTKNECVECNKIIYGLYYNKVNGKVICEKCFDMIHLQPDPIGPPTRAEFDEFLDAYHNILKRMEIIEDTLKIKKRVIEREIDGTILALKQVQQLREKIDSTGDDIEKAIVKAVEKVLSPRVNE